MKRHPKKAMRSLAILIVALLLPNAALPTFAQTSALGNPLNPSSLNKSQDPMDLFMRLQQLSNTGSTDFDSGTELDSAIRNFRKQQAASTPDIPAPSSTQQPQP
jgi:hypothetical protein